VKAFRSCLHLVEPPLALSIWHQTPANDPITRNRLAGNPLNGKQRYAQNAHKYPASVQAGHLIHNDVVREQPTAKGSSSTTLRASSGWHHLILWGSAAVHKQKRNMLEIFRSWRRISSFPLPANSCSSSAETSKWFSMGLLSTPGHKHHHGNAGWQPPPQPHIAPVACRQLATFPWVELWLPARNAYPVLLQVAPLCEPACGLVRLGF